jgi:hypothetical protein
MPAIWWALSCGAALVPARDVQGAAVVGGDDDAAKRSVVGVAHDGPAVLLGADPGGELAIPVAAEEQANLAEVLLLVGLLVFVVVRVGWRGGLARRGLVLLDQLLDLGLAEIGLEEGEVVVHPAEAPQGLGRQRRRCAELCVIAALGLDRAALAQERDGAVAAVERVGEPGGDQRRRDPALARRDVPNVLEHREVHRALEAAHLHLGLRVSGRTRGGAVVLGPQHAAEVGARGDQLVPVVAVEVPLRVEQLADHESPIEQSALRLVERLELVDRQVAPRAVEVLGLGEHVARLGAKLRLDVGAPGRRLARARRSSDRRRAGAVRARGARPGRAARASATGCRRGLPGPARA